MPTLKGSQTEKNVLTAFAGESQARNRYSFYAKQAKKDGFVQISMIFARTAEQERAHAKTLYKFLEGGDATITAAYPAGIIGGTVENLQSAIAGERYEHETMYPDFAKIAKEEGFIQIATAMQAIAIAEKQHDITYSGLVGNIEAGRVFQRDSPVTWYCTKCGYTHEGVQATERCPACSHSQSYFEILAENW